MKIYSWNVNGVRAVEKKGLMSQFLAFEHPDVLCLQEIKANEEDVSDIFGELYPAYEQYWHSADKKGYAGTAIWSKIPPENLIVGLPEDIIAKYQLTDDYGDTSREGRVITAEFEHFYVSTVYTPNAKDDLSRIPMRQQWDPAYLEYMGRLQADKPIIFCGDFNVAHEEIDLARPKANAGKKGFTNEERSGFDAMQADGFVDTFRHFTSDAGHYSWWSQMGGARARNVGWRIDYVMASSDLMPVVKRAQIHPDVMGSDHCPVSIELSL